MSNIRILTENLAFFSIALRRVFSFRPDWHQQDRAKPIVQQYRLELNTLLEREPERQRYVALLVQIIDGVTLGREAVIEWLLEAMRQRSMACPPRCSIRS